MSRTDRAIGIALGVIIGVVAVTVFVFAGSEQTIDAPSLEDGRERPAREDPGARARAPTVEVLGGEPTDVLRLTAVEGDRVRFRVVSDTALAIEVQGYGLSRDVPAGGSAVFEFRASRSGDFPIVIEASRIAVASLSVRPAG